MGKALEVNASLADLNISLNDLSPEGGVALADALRVNASLTQVRHLPASPPHA